MRIGIVVPSLIKYDAVGNDVVNMYEILLEEKYDVCIYAQSWDKELNKKVKIKPIKYAGSVLDDSKALIIYHYAIYTDFHEFILKGKCKKIFRYHNITPPYFFEKYDEFAARICRLGNEQMRGTVNKFDYFLSASEFNNNELTYEFGIDPSKTFILPPFHNVEKWEIIREDTELIPKLGRGVNILNVGRLVPNKNHKFLIKAFADYFYTYNKNAFLHIVGKIGPVKYYEEIQELIKKLRLENNIILYEKGISERELKTLYKYSDIFLITSLHEGFCVPVIEAMYFGKPIIALSSTALPYTIGNSGILIPEEDEIYFSAAINEITKNRVIYDYLRQLSLNRYQYFSFNTLKNNFLQFVKGFVLPS